MAIGALTVLSVTDGFRGGSGHMTGALFGRVRLFDSHEENTAA